MEDCYLVSHSMGPITDRSNAYGDHLTTSKTNCRARYIRDHCGISSDGINPAFCEIAAYTTDSDGITNVALGKTVTASQAVSGGALYHVTDGQYYTESSFVILNQIGEDIPYVTVDLGAVYDLTNIITWHKNDTFVTYQNTSTEVSEDGITWNTVFDSSVSGTYQEKIAGNIIFEKKIHDITDFSIYTNFTTDAANSLTYARIVEKGSPGGIANYPRCGWSISRYQDTTTGDFRIDVDNKENMLGRIPNIWDTGHSLVYCWDDTSNTMFAYKDWKLITDMQAANNALASGSIVTYPISDRTLINPFPLVLSGSIRTFIQWGRKLIDEDVQKLSKCVL